MSDPGQTHFVGDDCLPDGHREERVEREANGRTPAEERAWLYEALSKEITAKDEARARLAALEAALGEEIDNRDRLERLLDQFAWAVAPISVIGEHSSANDPWANALDMLIGWKARAERAEDALETIHIQATGIGYEVAHRYFEAEAEGRAALSSTELEPDEVK